MALILGARQRLLTGVAGQKILTAGTTILVVKNTLGAEFLLLKIWNGSTGGVVSFPNFYPCWDGVTPSIVSDASFNAKGPANGVNLTIGNAIPWRIHMTQDGGVASPRISIPYPAVAINPTIATADADSVFLDAWCAFDDDAVATDRNLRLDSARMPLLPSYPIL